jgi:HAMP domain-containing protein
MSGWIIALIVATIVLIGVLVFAVARVAGKASRLLDSVTQVTNGLNRHEVVEKVGVVLKKFADLEEIAKDKLGVDQKRELEEMKSALEQLRNALTMRSGDKAPGEMRPAIGAEEPRVASAE